jgi:hypothetical protein
MGMYFRESVRIGLFWVNFSGTGIGVSAGIPGLRFGAGTHGNYLQMGAHGIYYRSSLSTHRASRPSPYLAPNTPPGHVEPIVPENTLEAFEALIV